MKQETSANKRIAKNTFYMYIRMLVQMAVAFYTVRVIFNALGTDNYGIYNVVAGVIVFFTFLNSGLTSATKRYVTSEIAKGTEDSGSHIFNTCVIAHILISGIVLVFAETVGVWLVNHILNIPADRMVAANWVFQLSIFSAVVAIMQSPFDATIVAYEKMEIYAYFSILDVVLKLAIVFALKYIEGDKLIIYSWLLFGTFVITFLVNSFYCHHTFPICKWKYKKDSKLLKEIFKFMSWNLLGQLAAVGTNQGVSMLINVYFNVAVNAAMGVSNQIINNVNKFVINFQVAFNPQIIKSYTNKDFDYLQKLIIRSSKISSYLIIIFLVPMLFETHNVLSIWLGNYPPYAVEFCLLTIVSIYIEAIGAPLWMLQYSQTNVKTYQIVISAVYGLIFLISWLLLATIGISMPPYYIVVVRIILFILILLIRLIFANRLLSLLKIRTWLYEVFYKGFFIIFLASLIIGICSYIIVLPSFWHIIVITIISFFVTTPIIYIIGFNKSERIFFQKIINKKLHLKYECNL